MENTSIDFLQICHKYEENNPHLNIILSKSNEIVNTNIWMIVWENCRGRVANNIRINLGNNGTMKITYPFSQNLLEIAYKKI